MPFDKALQTDKGNLSSLLHLRRCRRYGKLARPFHTQGARQLAFAAELGGQAPPTVNAAVSLIPIERNGTLRGYAGALPEVMGEVLQGTVDLYNIVGFEEPWICYLAFASGTPVGSCGFKSPPHDSRVEIAYFTFPDAEGRGIATAMAAALLAVAKPFPVIVAAQTLPERNASHRVLEKLGFKYVETVVHPEDGSVWEWRLSEANGA